MIIRNSSIGNLADKYHPVEKESFGTILNFRIITLKFV